VAGELDGPYEYYYESGSGTIKMGRECGECFVGGEIATYDTCPPDLEDGNSPLVASVASSHTQLSSTVLLVLSCGSE